jgi:hypothetical protein
MNIRSIPSFFLPQGGSYTLLDSVVINGRTFSYSNVNPDSIYKIEQWLPEIGSLISLGRRGSTWHIQAAKLDVYDSKRSLLHTVHNVVIERVASRILTEVDRQKAEKVEGTSFGVLDCITLPWSLTQSEHSPPSRTSGCNIRVRYGSTIESVDRVETIESTAAFLKHELKNASKEESFVYLRELRNLQIFSRLGKTTGWVSSQAYRSWLKKWGFREGQSTFPFAPVVNLRRHSIYGRYVLERTMVRHGAITHLKNGFISLKTLTRIEEELRAGESEALEAEINRLKLMENRFKGQNKILAIQDALQILRSAGLAEIKTLIHERTLILRAQFAAILMEHIRFETNIVNHGIFILSQVSLLNLNHFEINKSGWVHNERVAFEDLVTIMDMYDGAQVFCNPELEQPIISGGTISLPIDKPNFVLKTAVFNASVQTNRLNSEIQKRTNCCNALKIRDIAQNNLAEHALKALIESGKLSYHIAVELVFGLARLPSSVGINCQSGKDRTGIIAALSAQRFICKRLEHTVLDDRNPMIQIIHENTPSASVAKLNPITLIQTGLPGVPYWKVMLYALKILALTHKIPS